MMTPLEDAQRAQGGKNRAKNQTEDERKFLATLAASRRPLLYDAKLTPEQTVEAFKHFTAERRWLFTFIVGADRRTIRHTLPDDVKLQRVKLVRGAIGFLGVAFLGKSLQVLCKPLKRGTKVIEDLDRVGREITAVILEKLGQAKLPEIEL